MSILRNLLHHEVVQAKEPPNKEEPEKKSNLSDPMEELRDQCAHLKPIQDLFRVLGECTDRVNSKANTTETCEQELFDFLHERDHCVSKSLFDKLQ